MRLDNRLGWNRTGRPRTTRRTDAEAGISLLKRRAWFSDPPPATPPPATPPPPAQQPPAGDEIPDWVKSDPARAYKEIQSARSEAKESRTALADVQKRLEAIEAERKQKTEADLAEQNNFKQLLENRNKEYADLQTEVLKERRMRIGLAAGLPEALAQRLIGNTEDEIKADAEKVKSTLPQPTPSEPGRASRTTTSVPGGAAAQETDEQRRERLRRGGRHSPLSGVQVTHVRRPE